MESTYPNVASTVQQYESRNQEMESKVNDAVQKLKERHNLTDSTLSPSSSFSSTSSYSPAVTAKHHNQLPTASESHQQSSLSAADAVAMDTYQRNLLADINRLPHSVSPDPKGRTTDEGPEVDSEYRGVGLDLRGGTGDDHLSLKEQSKNKLETESNGM